MMNDEPDVPADEPKLKPSERAERTHAAFIEIVSKQKVAEDAQTVRLRKARLKRDAEESKS